MRFKALYVLLLFQCLIHSAVNRDQFDFQDGFRTGTDDYSIQLRNIGKFRQREASSSPHSHIIYVKAEDLIPLIRQGKFSAADLSSLKLKESLFRPGKTPPVQSANPPSRSRWRFPDEKPPQTDPPPVFSPGLWRPTDPSTLKTLLSGDRSRRPLQNHVIVTPGYQDPVQRPQPISVLHNYRYRPSDPSAKPDPIEKPVAEKPLVYTTEKPEIQTATQQDYHRNPVKPARDPLVEHGGIPKDPSTLLGKLHNQDRYRPAEPPLVELKPIAGQIAKDPYQPDQRLQDQERFKYSLYHPGSNKEINTQYPVKVGSIREQDHHVDDDRKPLLSYSKPILPVTGVTKDQGLRYPAQESSFEDGKQDQDRLRKPKLPAINPTVTIKDPSSRYVTKVTQDHEKNQDYYRKAPIPLLAPIVPLTGSFEDLGSEELYAQDPYKHDEDPKNKVPQHPPLPLIDPLVTSKGTVTNPRDQDRSQLRDPVSKIVDIQGLKEFYGGALLDQVSSDRPKNPTGSFARRPKFYGLAAAKILHAHGLQETLRDLENFIPAVPQRINPQKNRSRPTFPPLAILEPIQTEQTFDPPTVTESEEIYSDPVRPGKLRPSSQIQNDPEISSRDPAGYKKRPDVHQNVPVVQTPKTERRPGLRSRIPPRKGAEQANLKDVIQQYEDHTQTNQYHPDDFRPQPTVRPLPPSLKPSQSYPASYEDIVIPYDATEDPDNHKNPETSFNHPFLTKEEDPKSPVRFHSHTVEISQDPTSKDSARNPYKPAYAKDYERPELPQGPVRNYPTPKYPVEDSYRNPSDKDRLPIEEDFEDDDFPPLKTVPSLASPESQDSQKPAFPPLPILEPIQTDMQSGNPVFESSVPNVQKDSSADMPSYIEDSDPYSPALVPGFKTSLTPKVSLRPHGITHSTKENPAEVDPAEGPVKVYFEEPITSGPAILSEQGDPSPYRGPVGPPLPGKDSYEEDYATPTTLRPLTVDLDDYFREKNQPSHSMKPTGKHPTEGRPKPVPRREPKRKQKFDFTPKGPFPSPAPRPREPKNLEEGSLLSKYPLPAKQAAQDGFGKRIRPLKRTQLAGLIVSEPATEKLGSIEAVNDGNRKRQRPPRVDLESSRARKISEDLSDRKENADAAAAGVKLSPRPLVRSRGSPLPEKHQDDDDSELETLLEQLKSNPHMEFSLEINPENNEEFHPAESTNQEVLGDSFNHSTDLDEATFAKYSELLEQLELEPQLELESQLTHDEDEENLEDSRKNPDSLKGPNSSSDLQPTSEDDTQSAKDNYVSTKLSSPALDREEDRTELPLLKRFPFRNKGAKTAEKSPSKVFVIELNQGPNRTEKSTVSGFKYTPKSRSPQRSLINKSIVKRTRLGSNQPSDIRADESVYSVYLKQDHKNRESKLDKQLFFEGESEEEGEDTDDPQEEDQNEPLKLYLLRTSLSSDSSERRSYVLATDSLPEALEDPEGLISFLQDQQRQEQQVR